ncbi:MAG: pyridoxamine 5'-phosphate oxidase [Candidatus Eiseniibacteriota bacterium]
MAEPAFRPRRSRNAPGITMPTTTRGTPAARATRERRAALLPQRMSANPFVQFERWYGEARRAIPHQPEAMTLATATRGGRPSARMVLLKFFGAGGFGFFTHYHSRKGLELRRNPRAALVLYWAPLGRQVRIEGRVRRESAVSSDRYFAGRPRGSQLSAAISPQSRVIANREQLERWRAGFERATAGRAIERPADWGGFRLTPELIEFWQQGEHRLHDRIRYRRRGSRWIRERLAP